MHRNTTGSFHAGILLFLCSLVILALLSGSRTEAYGSVPSAEIPGEMYARLADGVSFLKSGSMTIGSTFSLGDVIRKGYRDGYWIRYRGDFSFIGVFITVLYGLIFVFSLQLILKMRHSPPVKDHVHIWYAILALFLAAGINKQLDIQMLIADFARAYARSEGVYAHRRQFQTIMMAVFASIGVGAFTFIVYHFRDAPKKIWLAFLGLSMLFSIMIIRLVSLHGLEAFIRTSFHFFTVADVIELTGMALVFIALLSNRAGRK